VARNSGPQNRNATMTEPVTAPNPSPAAPVRVAGPAPGVVQSHKPVTEAQQAFSDMRRGADQMAGYVDPATHVIERKPNGELVVKPRADGGNQPASPGDQRQPGAGEQQPGQATVTADGRLQVGDLFLDNNQIKEILAADAEQKSRRANLPADASAYTLDLPADFKMPEGVDFRWEVNHPVFGPMINQAREFAHSIGLDQATFSRMMGLYAASQTYEAKVIADVKRAELEKLGATAHSRVDAVKTFLRAHCGDASAKAITDVMWRADFLTGLEKIMARMSSQGAGNWSGAGRDGGTDTRKLSSEQYGKLSYSEKLDYARQFPQSGA
jgi:hypothetical protein